MDAADIAIQRDEIEQTLVLLAADLTKATQARHSLLAEIGNYGAMLDRLNEHEA